MSMRRLFLPVVALCAAPLALAHSDGPAPSGGTVPGPAPDYSHLSNSGRADWSRVISLAHVLRPDSPLFPGDPELTITEWNTVENDGYKLEQVSLGTHTGTHVSAPCHFIDGKPCIDDLPAKMFIRPVAVIDVRDRIRAEGGDFELSKSDLRDWEREHGRIPEGAMVLLNTGFGDDYFDDDYFADAPGFSGEAVHWLMKPVSQGGRGAAGTGSDTFGPDATSDVLFDASYETYLANGVTIENAKRLGALPPLGATIVFLPARLVDGSGFQTNIIALLP